jgi:RNA polymerase sigma-70 factor (ECF subfamily)
LQKENKTAEFEEAVMPHLDAAFNLARWLARNDTDAEDILHEAYLRAFKFFNGFHGVNGRAWTLRIVRNTYYSWIQKNKTGEQITEFDEEIHGATEFGNPETVLIEQVDRQELRRMLDELPVEFREIVVLRDLEGLSYKEIANIADLPLGTVMSRLARARERLMTRAAALQKKEVLK